MASSSRQSFEEDAATPYEIFRFECRLQHELNDRCLLEIFDHLSLEGLTKLCNMDSSFSDFICKEIIAKKVIDFGWIDEKLHGGESALKQSTIKHFERFGKFMNKFKVRGHNINLFFDAIVKYCKPDTFTQVHLTFLMPGINALSVSMLRAMPYFSKIRKLYLFDAHATGGFRNFLTLLSNGPSASSLQILRLDQVNIEGGWLQYMRNLTELQINGSRRIATGDLSSFFTECPKLATFEYSGCIDISEVFSILPVCCPRLESFRDCHSSLRNKSQADRYKFLSAFTQLKNVTLTSYTETDTDLSQISELANVPKFEIFKNWERFHHDLTTTMAYFKLT